MKNSLLNENILYCTPLSNVKLLFISTLRNINQTEAAMSCIYATSPVEADWRITSIKEWKGCYIKQERMRESVNESDFMTHRRKKKKKKAMNGTEIKR